MTTAVLLMVQFSYSANMNTLEKVFIDTPKLDLVLKYLHWNQIATLTRLAWLGVYDRYCFISIIVTSWRSSQQRTAWPWSRVFFCGTISLYQRQLSWNLLVDVWKQNGFLHELGRWLMGFWRTTVAKLWPLHQRQDNNNVSYFVLDID